MNNLFKFVFSLGLPLVAGFLGSIFTTPAIEGWYVGLEKPLLNPPAWVFAPVWTILYLMMGLALFLVWQQGIKNARVRTGLLVFGIQLVLNVFWSIIFFAWHSPAFAFIELLFLWVSIIWLIYLFYRIRAVAAYLLVPYLLWVTFAGYLNFSIWFLN